MKKIIMLLMAIMPMIVNAQNGKVVVTLKNGTTIVGDVKSIDPTDAITIVVAGIETTIKMSDVSKVEEVDTDPSVTLTSTDNQLDEKTKLIVTDFADYPDSIYLVVGNKSVKMILVRGGDMYMGYNGRHSLSMKSEPVHKVGVTSFYMSEIFVTSEIVSQVTGKTRKKYYYSENIWNKTNNLVQRIAAKTGLQVRLPTEAEWEYAACSPVQDKLFTYCQGAEYCSDWYDTFKDIEYRIDPTGPIKGKNRVIRAYNGKRGKFNRSLRPFDDSFYNNIFFRLVIKAKDIKVD